MKYEIQQFDQLIPSYEKALTSVASMMEHDYKHALESTFIGPLRDGFTVAVSCETGLRPIGFTLQETPYASYQEALKAFGAMMDDITARKEGRAELKDLAWWENHLAELKEKYGFEL